jgi:uncharacterized damage-inducible protein DinB
MIALLDDVDWSCSCGGGAHAVSRPPAVLPLVGLLRQLARVLESLTDEQYVLKPAGVLPSSIGGHVRHSLDRVAGLLGGLREGVVDYDRRRHGPEVERSRRAALEALRRDEHELLTFPWEPRRPLQVAVLLAPGAPAAEVLTSPERELAFVFCHTVHHNALIAVIARLLGVPLPEDFGYAPSTIARRRAQACAR